MSEHAETMAYSETIEGDATNHQQSVRFDVMGGYVGISQGRDRVLLTPEQFKALKRFVGASR